MLLIIMGPTFPQGLNSFNDLYEHHKTINCLRLRSFDIVKDTRR